MRNELGQLKLDAHVDCVCPACRRARRRADLDEGQWTPLSWRDRLYIGGGTLAGLAIWALLIWWAVR